MKGEALKADLTYKPCQESLVSVLGHKHAMPSSRTSDLEESPFSNNVLGPLSGRQRVVPQTDQKGKVPLQTLGAVKSGQIHTTLFRGLRGVGSLRPQKPNPHSFMDQYLLQTLELHVVPCENCDTALW